MLSVRELSFLEEQLMMEKVQVKKYTAYARVTRDPQIKVKCEQLAAKHQSHYERLHTLLQ